MHPKSFSLLYSALIAVLLTIILQSVEKTEGKSITTETSSSSSDTTTTSPIFALPTRIEDDDIPQEYVRFMTSIMNENIDPCEDFYQYACGNWKHSEIVPEKSRNNTFIDTIESQVNEMLIKFLKNTTEEELKTNTAESKAKMFYSSCLKMNNEMERGYKELLELEEFQKELKASSENETLDWININFMSSFGVYPLLPLKGRLDEEARKYELRVTPPKAILNSSNPIDIKNLTSDFKIENDVLQKNFVKEFEDMVNFEKSLISQVNTRNESESVTLDDFLTQHKEDAFNWTRYFNVAFNGSEKSDWTIHYTIEDITPLVRFLNKTNLETMRNYVKWCTLFKFYSIWKPMSNTMQQEDFCSIQTKIYFGDAIAPWIIENVYDADRRADILGVAEHVKETFYDLIDKYTWLDDETKSNAKTKLSSMDIDVGYSDDMRHKELINQVYTDINMTEDWFKNIFVMESNQAKKNLSLVNEAVTVFKLSTYVVNSRYLSFLNSVDNTIAIAQSPFYHIKYPASLKFGGIGCVMGHEMAHGFDSSGYQVNYDGKIQNWWTEGALRNFRERYRCLESQYNKYIYRGVATNGTFTSGDNIADNVGTRTAYKAYMNRFGNLEGDKKPISGLNFTNKQLFFLKFAQTWCDGRDDASIINEVKVGDHAIGEFRVDGSLKNMPEFSEVFQCKLGSNMNPLKKCVVW